MWEQDGETSIEYDRQKPWDDPANLRLEEDGARSLLFQYTQIDVDPEQGSAKYGDCTTYYKVITGPDTAFSSTPSSLSQLPEDLILVVRVEQSDTHWMEPRDLSIEELLPSKKTKHLLLGKAGYAVLFADGDPWVLSAETPISDLCKFFTLTGAKQYDRGQLLARYRVL